MAKPTDDETVHKLDKLANDGEDTGSYPVEEKYEPTYRMMAAQKIAVSKKTGPLWKSRKKAAWTKLETNGELKRWRDAIRYYRNDHSVKDRHEGDGSTSGITLTTQGVETENIVFANVTALVPAVYAKNPTIEISMDNPDFDTFGKTAEKLVNALMRMEHSPGVNLKPKARRIVISCVLTNEGWLEVGYNTKETSSDAAVKELDEIAKQLAEAKDIKTIQECEGKLEALEDKIDLLSSSAPFTRVRAPHHVLVDTDATMDDERRWLMYCDYVSTDMLRALYGTKNEKGEYDSVFAPSHVLKLKSDEQVDNEKDDAFSFLGNNPAGTYKDHGYDDENTFRRSQRTKVWYVWDKVTRRVYLFNDADWKWPLWVWDDPYNYPDFYPLVRVNFYDDPEEYYARSETMMYLDQQDAINAINNETAKVRAYLTGKVIYNSNIVKDDKIVDAFLDGTSNRRAIGVDVPADVDLTKLFHAFVPQTAGALNTVVFDKARLLEAIDRVSSVTSVMRGVEYKTNTTNKAIESYESTTQTRLDEKIDAIEDALGKVGTKLLHVCLRYMDAETVASILGDKDAQVWDEHRNAFLEGNVKFTANIAGGSTLKPTSATKKQQAVQIAQALGQYAGAAPISILVALRVMERAFDEVIIRDEDWEMIIKSVEQQLMRGQSVPQEGQAPQEGQPSEGGGGEDLVVQIEKLVDSFPQEAKMFLAKLIAEGTPVRQAVEQVVAELQQPQAGA